MKVQALGHAVLKVRNQQTAEQFYGDVLGLPIVARHETMPMTFFSLGNHHDFAVLAVGDDAPAAPQNAPGLFHVAFKIGDTIDELREAKERLEAAGVQVDRVIDHTVSQSLYLRDPDGNGIELYIDGSDVWKDDPQQVAQGVPLTI
jgi:catechol 2,3-dioxygenase